MYERHKHGRGRQNSEEANKLIEGLLADLERPKWKEISETNGLADRFSKKLSLKTNQLRRFFDSVKKIDEKIDTGSDWSAVENDVWRLIPILKYAKARGLCKEPFVKFIEKGLDKIASYEDDEKKTEALKNFVRIFEAVVAYSKYHSKSKEA